jgi:hypothetical protein
MFVQNYQCGMLDLRHFFKGISLLIVSRLAHRIRDMQTLPYVVVSNQHISEVYDLYYQAFETLRKVREVKTLEDNDALCERISQTLRQHLPVIPKLAMGILECRHLMKPDDMDRFMNTILRSVSFH